MTGFLSKALGLGELFGAAGGFAGDIREAVTGEEGERKYNLAKSEQEQKNVQDLYNFNLANTERQSEALARREDAELRRLELTNSSKYQSESLNAQTAQAIADREERRADRQADKEERLAQIQADKEERNALVAAKQAELAAQLLQKQKDADAAFRAQQINLAQQELVERSRMNQQIVTENRAYAEQNFRNIAQRMNAGQSFLPPERTHSSPLMSTYSRNPPLVFDRGINQTTYLNDQSVRQARAAVRAQASEGRFSRHERNLALLDAEDRRQQAKEDREYELRQRHKKELEEAAQERAQEAGVAEVKKVKTRKQSAGNPGLKFGKPKRKVYTE